MSSSRSGPISEPGARFAEKVRWVTWGSRKTWPSNEEEPLTGPLGILEETREEVMECGEFLESYSEYLDGQAESPHRTVFEQHLGTCESCARYHRVVQRGLFIYRNLPRLRPSPDFIPRLKHRLYHVDDAARLAGRSPLGSAALVAVAAVGCLALAWLPFATRLSLEVALPPVAVETPPEGATPSLFSAGPFLVRDGGYVVPAAGWSYDGRGSTWSYTTAAAGRVSSSTDAFFQGTSLSSEESAQPLNATTPPTR